MIFDCFLYNGEKECLKIRCEELKELHPIHVLVESRNTFTRKPKALRFPDIEHEFKDYNIRYIIVDEVSIEDDAWATEELHRNAIMRGLYDAKDEDVIIISDVDEIPKLEAVKSYNAEMGTVGFCMDMFYWKLNCLHSKGEWKSAKMLTYGELKKSNPEKIRRGGHKTEIENSGHHFSWLGDGKFALNKIESFSHTEYNIPGLSVKSFQDKIDNCEDMCTERRFEIVPIDETFPKYIQENISEFKHLIK